MDETRQTTVDEAELGYGATSSAPKVSSTRSSSQRSSAVSTCTCSSVFTGSMIRRFICQSFPRWCLVHGGKYTWSFAYSPLVQVHQNIVELYFLSLMHDVRYDSVSCLGS